MLDFAKTYVEVQKGKNSIATYLLTCELEAPSRQCQELVELPVEHLLGDQPRIGQGDANLHVLQT
jgi:hypothetical protein